MDRPYSFLIAIFVCGFLALPASAQDEIVSQESFPSATHEFWDRGNITLYSAAAAAAAADFWTTRRVMANGGHEKNPLARPFAGSDATFAAYKAANVGGYLGLSYLFHRKGWHQLERILPMVAISTDGAAAGFNLKVDF